MRPCKVCGGRKRVQIVTAKPGLTMFFDCPACRVVPQYRVLKTTIAKLERDLRHSRLASVIFGIAALIGILGAAQ